MRALGELGRVDETTPNLPVVLDLARGRLRLMTGEELLGSWPVGRCALDHVHARRFRLILPVGTFDLVVDDPVALLRDGRDLLDADRSSNPLARFVRDRFGRGRGESPIDAALARLTVAASPDVADSDDAEAHDLAVEEVAVDEPVVEGTDVDDVDVDDVDVERAWATGEDVEDDDPEVVEDVEAVADEVEDVEDIEDVDLVDDDFEVGDFDAEDDVEMDDDFEVDDDLGAEVGGGSVSLLSRVAEIDLAVRRRDVTDADLAFSYREAGSGAPIVLLHGGVASTALWREVLPGLASYGRCLAVDLVGVQSTSPTPTGDAFRWQGQTRQLDLILTELGVTDDIVLVLHGWATIAGLLWACEHTDRVVGICIVEALLAPLPPQDLRPWLRRFSGKSAARPAARNLPTEEFLAGAVAEMTSVPLSPELLAELGAELGTSPEDRRGVTSGLRQLPIASGSPNASSRMLVAGTQWLAGSSMPTLIVRGAPGYFLRADRPLPLPIPEATEVTIEGGHLLPLESPDALLGVIGDWLDELDGVETVVERAPAVKTGS